VPFLRSATLRDPVPVKTLSKVGLLVTPDLRNGASVLYETGHQY
jgi:hypothetical protein